MIAASADAARSGWRTSSIARASRRSFISLAATIRRWRKRVVERGAVDCVVRERIDHRRLANSLRDAVQRRRQELALWRTSAQAQQLSRFGPVNILGHRFIRELAIGGTSMVYLAESERAGDLVVLKVLRDAPETGDQHMQFSRFLQEYELISKIRHPNVVRIYDLGISDDHAYIAMEYFQRGDLRGRIAKGIEPRLALSYLSQMAAALQVVHEVGVLHRDLKPGNIMERADGCARDHRFRPGEAHRGQCGYDRHRRDFRHAVLHEPGAGPRPAARRAQRFV